MVKQLDCVSLIFPVRPTLPMVFRWVSKNDSKRNRNECQYLVHSSWIVADGYAWVHACSELGLDADTVAIAIDSVSGADVGKQPNSTDST